MQTRKVNEWDGRFPVNVEFEDWPAFMAHYNLEVVRVNGFMPNGNPILIVRFKSVSGGVQCKTEDSAPEKKCEQKTEKKDTSCTTAPMGKTKRESQQLQERLF